MKAIVVLFAAIIFFSSCASSVLSQGGGGAGGLPQCLTKLMPCMSALGSQDPNPGEFCCRALNNALDNEADCLCEIFDSAAALKKYRIDREQLMELPGRCGFPAPDLNRCRGGTAASPGPSAAAAPSHHHPPNRNDTVTPPPPAPQGTPSDSSSLDLGVSMVNVILSTLIGMYSVTSFSSV